MLGSTNVAARVAALAAAGTPRIDLTLDDIAASSQINTDPDNSQIGVTFRSDAATSAVTVANLFLKAYEETRSEAATADTKAALDEFDTTIESIDKQISDLDDQISAAIEKAAGTDLAAKHPGRARRCGEAAGFGRCVGPQQRRVSAELVDLA